MQVVLYISQIEAANMVQLQFCEMLLFPAVQVRLYQFIQYIQQLVPIVGNGLRSDLA